MDNDGLVLVAPILGWEDVDFPARLRRVLPPDLPVLVENDGNAFAIGAVYGHSAPRHGVTLFVVLETGVGAGIAIDGVLVRGGHGLAGEVGHMLVPDPGAPGRLCPLEAVVGLEAVLAAYAAEAGLDRPALAEFLARVRDREPAAVTVAEGWSRTLAFALVQVCRLIDPEHIVLGGWLAALYPLVSARVVAHVRGDPGGELSVALDRHRRGGVGLGVRRRLHAASAVPVARGAAGAGGGGGGGGVSLR